MKKSNVKKVYQYDLNWNFIKEFKSQAEASRFFKCNSSSICRAIQNKYRVQNGYLTSEKVKIGDEKVVTTEEDPLFDFKYEESKDKAQINTENFISSQPTKPKVLNDFLKQSDVDLEIWEVDRYIIHGHDVTMKFEADKQIITKTNYGIKVFLKKKEINEASILKEIVKDFKVPLFNSKYKPKFHKETGIALEIATLDAHLGKLAYIEEVGYRDYNTNIACQDYEYAVDKNLAWSQAYDIEKIFFIVGQDLFHIDNMNNNTTKGTHTMDVDKRLSLIIRKAYDTILICIYKCRNVAPVEIIWSPGNHDTLASMFLCHMLEEHFKNDKHVTVDIDKNNKGLTRKCRLWGNLLVGWTHRITTRQNAWINELAQLFPKEWGESKFREWHFGDQHKKKTTISTIEDTQGSVMLRQLTALSPIDKWHFDNLFTDAVPGGEAFLWSKDVGIFSNQVAWLGQCNEQRNKIVKK